MPGSVRPHASPAWTASSAPTMPPSPGSSLPPPIAESSRFSSPSTASDVPRFDEPQLMASEPSFTIGIEEEYLLVDRPSRTLVGDPPPAMLAECESLLAGQVSPEFLRSQIEVGTRKCETLQEARADLARLRATVAEVAARH